MSSDRFTKQGVRDLNAIGHNGHKNHGKKCQHWFVERVVIGTRWVVNRDYGYYDEYEERVYGHKCMWCPAIREERA